MKLASLKNGRDGVLVVVSRDLTRAAEARDIYPTCLQRALDDWQNAEPVLRDLAERLENGTAPYSGALKPGMLGAPLPRVYQWADGSAYVNHVELVRRARGAEMPPSFWHDPLMYQGGGDFLAPDADIVAADAQWGVDFEGEVAVILHDTPAGIAPEDAPEKIALLALVNDVSSRNLVPAELAKGFGFFHAKPPGALSPVAVTPDELGDAWRDTRVHLPLLIHLNGEEFGRANAGVDMVFNFARLISHAAKTRPLKAGAVIGGGTISNKDSPVGSSCVAERRMLEVVAGGAARTPFLRDGDVVRMEMLDEDGRSIFGAIEQRVRIGAPEQVKS